MNVGGQVDRTFPPERIPAGRIGTAIELDIETVPGRGLLHFHADQFFQGPPSRSAGRSAFHVNRFDPPLLDFGLELRSSVELSITSQPTQPGQGASYRRSRNEIGGRIFFRRCHQWNPGLPTTLEKLRHEVGMTQKT